MGAEFAAPTYRILGDRLILSWSSDSTSNIYLRIEAEAAPPQLVGDSSVLPADYPAVLESLLIYDTALAALAIEDAEDVISAERAVAVANGARLGKLRDEYLARFLEYTSTRSYGATYATPFYLGD